MTGDTCESGYTGTACQYADAAFRGARSPDAMNISEEVVADEFKDQSGTCVTSHSSVSATWMVQLSALSWVTQVNVHVPEKAQRPEHVRLQEGSGGDIDEAPLQFVREEGENLVYRPRQPRRASGVCITAPSGLMTSYKVHVISGRNLALKKSASKSPNDTNTAKGADKAVDHETNQVGPDTCTEVWYPQLRIVWTVITGGCVRMCAPVRTQQKYVTRCWGPVHKQAAGQGGVDSDVKSVSGSPGNCQTTHSCHEAYYDYITRCAPGYYGDGCETKCDECIDEDCDPVNGTCMRGCLAGWTGDRCDEACPTGTYGNNCKNTCSVHCEDQDCFPGNGTCTKPCPPGQTGSFCDKVCANGTYGYSCASICSDVCVESICHPVNGTCSRGCKTGLVGDDCSQEYTSVTFGPERRDKGSTNCASGEPPPNLSGIFATCFSIGFVISLAVYVTIKRRTSEIADGGRVFSSDTEVKSFDNTDTADTECQEL
ncbi:hypothetical protein C0Q70_21345 [Pomacea canaliculata]|uniref:EGF-like domain-containing protein n=1 Tax=Pomacea canaliculata TaxID=400727 RepID=A0A2T7NC92_POMCA|nr:hypothetical protein C0Q70_21345 [Pomacea canaliculata]